MKNKLILMALLVMVALPANAIVSSDYDIKSEDIENTGYSKHMAELVEIRSAQAKGQVPAIKDEPDYGYKCRWIKRFFTYIDPALDEEGTILRHNINPNPSVNDM